MWPCPQNAARAIVCGFQVFSELVQLAVDSTEKLQQAQKRQEQHPTPQEMHLAESVLTTVCELLSNIVTSK